MKTVKKQTYANITVRNKRKHDGDKEISEDGYRKRAKMISNILDHASNNDKKVKTKLLAKVIDQDPFIHFIIVTSIKIDLPSFNL